MAGRHTDVQVYSTVIRHGQGQSTLYGTTLSHRTSRTVALGRLCNFKTGGAPAPPSIKQLLSSGCCMPLWLDAAPDLSHGSLDLSGQPPFFRQPLTAKLHALSCIIAQRFAAHLLLFGTLFETSAAESDTMWWSNVQLGQDAFAFEKLIFEPRSLGQSACTLAYSPRPCLGALSLRRAKPTLVSGGKLACGTYSISAHQTHIQAPVTSVLGERMRNSHDS